MMNKIFILSCIRGVLRRSGGRGPEKFSGGKPPDPHFLLAPLACPPHFLAAGAAPAYRSDFRWKFQNGLPTFISHSRKGKGGLYRHPCILEMRCYWEFYFIFHFIFCSIANIIRQILFHCLLPFLNSKFISTLWRHFLI